MSSDSKPDNEAKETPQEKPHEGEKTEAKEGAETVYKPLAPSSADLEVASPGHSGVLPSQQMLLELAKKDFDLDEVWNVTEIHVILGEHGWEEVSERTEAKFEKWLRKRKFEISEHDQRKTRKAFLIFTLLDYCVSRVNNLFLIRGAMRGMYRSYAEHVMSSIIKYDPSGWLKPAYDRFLQWSQIEDLNKDILKVLTWVTLKAYAFFCKQMMR
jgi:hypothetical protein